MTATTDLLTDSFNRVEEGVKGVLDGIDRGHLTWRPDPESNTIAWLIWHVSRVQDDHLAAAFGQPQVWHSEGWDGRFGRLYEPAATGCGMTSEEVGRLAASAELLVGYHEAVAARAASFVAGVDDADLARIVDERWDPPVTLAVRLVSVIEDGLQHIGQAAYVRGLAERAGG
jgi:hypothetical protein